MSLEEKMGRNLFVSAFLMLLEIVSLGKVIGAIGIRQIVTRDYAIMVEDEAPCLLAFNI